MSCPTRWRIPPRSPKSSLHCRTADELVDRAEHGKLGYRDFSDLVLAGEVGVLEGRRHASRLKLSALPQHKTLDERDVTFQPELDPERIAEPRLPPFVEKKVSALILANSSSGSSQIANALRSRASRFVHLRAQFAAAGD